jgi:tripartite-type tricarboxylate transporter receptor subunit TctC
MDAPACAIRRAVLVALATARCQQVWAADPLGRQGSWRSSHDASLRIVVAYPPGGVSDSIARVLAVRLTEQLGVDVRVENRPGGSGVVALEALARSPADGSTLCFVAATAVALITRSRSLPEGSWPVIPVAGVMRTPLLVVGTPALRAGTFAGMLELARREPDRVRWATTGEGTTGYAVLDRVRRASGAGIVHVPYKGGGQQLTDALGGHFEVLSTNVAAQQLDAVRRGRLAALAVGAPSRLPVLPDTPTLAELGYGDAKLDSLFGLFAPPGTDAAIVKRLHAEVSTALRHPGLRTQLLVTNNTPFEESAAEFASQVRHAADR